MRAVLRRARRPRRSAPRCRPQPDALRVDAVSIGTPKSATHRRQRRRHPRHAARRLVAGPGRRQPRPDPRPRRCRRWPAAAGSPASASTRCSASSRSRPALDLRKDVLGWMGDAGVFVGGDDERRPRRGARHQDDRPGQDQAHDDRPRALRAHAERGRRRSRALHGTGIDDGLHGPRPDRPAGPGRPRRRSLRGRDRRQGACWPRRSQPGEQLGSSPALHRRGGQARQRPAALVLSRLHPGDEADRVLRRHRTPASSRPSPTSTPSARSSPAPRTRAPASPGRASS